MTSLQPKVAKLVNYVREGTWVCPPVGFEMMMKLLGRDPSASGTTSALMTIAFTSATYVLTALCVVKFTLEETERFKTDSEFFWSMRRAMDASLNVNSILLLVPL